MTGRTNAGGGGKSFRHRVEGTFSTSIYNGSAERLVTSFAVSGVTFQAKLIVMWRTATNVDEDIYTGNGSSMLFAYGDFENEIGWAFQTRGTGYGTGSGVTQQNVLTASVADGVLTVTSTKTNYEFNGYGYGCTYTYHIYG